MLPASTNGGGQCLGFPDVCKTPSPGGPIPIPYPNIAMCTQGKGSNKVLINNKQTLRQGDNIRMSSGDEAGLPRRCGCVHSKSELEVHAQNLDMLAQLRVGRRVRGTSALFRNSRSTGAASRSDNKPLR